MLTLTYEPLVLSLRDRARYVLCNKEVKKGTVCPYRRAVGVCLCLHGAGCLLKLLKTDFVTLGGAREVRVSRMHASSFNTALLNTAGESARACVCLCVCTWL